jgi:hypothetical protein
MRRIGRGITVIGVVLLGGCGDDSNLPSGFARSAAATPRAGANNAGDEYRRIYAAFGKPALDQYRPASQWNTVTPEMVRHLEANHKLVNELLGATTIGRCDFHVDSSDPSASMPHLTEMPALANILGADAIRLAKTGDREGAAERVAAIIRLSRHIGQDEATFPKIVAIGCTQRATEIAGLLVGQKAIDEAGMRKIAAELQMIDADDPFDAKSAIPAEQVALSKPLSGPVQDLMFGPEWRSMDQAARDAVLREISAGMDRIEAVWGDAAAESEIHKIASQAKSPITKKVLSSYAVYRKQTDACRQRIRDSLTKLAV